MPGPMSPICSTAHLTELIALAERFLMQADEAGVDPLTFGDTAPAASQVSHARAPRFQYRDHPIATLQHELTGRCFARLSSRSRHRTFL
jgi:hypothetical protein